MRKTRGRLTVPVFPMGQSTVSVVGLKRRDYLRHEAIARRGLCNRDKCVYVLMDRNDEPAYIGSTKRLFQRVRTHRRERRIRFRWVIYFALAERNQYGTEYLFIRHFLPYRNKRHIPKQRSAA